MDLLNQPQNLLGILSMLMGLDLDHQLPRIMIQVLTFPLHLDKLGHRLHSKQRVQGH